MRSEAIRRAGVIAVVVSGAVLQGCVTQAKPLYYWGDYQPEVYAYFKGDGADINEQRIKLDETAEKARAKGEALPPGFNAHLGLLYLKAGQADEARLAFQTEEAQFPESKAYMDFLLRNFDRQNENGGQ